jgi:hypothetical protein
MSGARRAWSAEEIERAAELARMERSAREIAAELGRSKAAVDQILFKLRSQGLLARRERVVPHEVWVEPAPRWYQQPPARVRLWRQAHEPELARPVGGWKPWFSG